MRFPGRDIQERRDRANQWRGIANPAPALQLLPLRVKPGRYQGPVTRPPTEAAYPVSAFTRSSHREVLSASSSQLCAVRMRIVARGIEMSAAIPSRSHASP
jgi:hypothetical protein